MKGGGAITDLFNQKMLHIKQNKQNLLKEEKNNLYKQLLSYKNALKKIQYTTRDDFSDQNRDRFLSIFPLEIYDKIINIYHEGCNNATEQFKRRSHGSHNVTFLYAARKQNIKSKTVAILETKLTDINEQFQSVTRKLQTIEKDIMKLQGISQINPTSTFDDLNNIPRSRSPSSQSTTRGYSIVPRHTVDLPREFFGPSFNSRRTNSTR